MTYYSKFDIINKIVTINKERNPLQFYFGKVSQEDMEISGSADLFENEGNYYYYLMEINDEGFQISDTCGRYVPIDRNSAREFGITAFAVEKVYAAEDEAHVCFKSANVWHAIEAKLKEKNHG